MDWRYKIDQFNIQQREHIEVSVDLESHEYNGRWYTAVKAWKVSRRSSDTDSPKSFGSQGSDAPPVASITSFDNDDFPF
tara:strand:+ start:7208 stop:7444 length:237 start_codon:yes stop_codon:yes gene_type:complete